MTDVFEICFVMAPRQNLFFRELADALRFELGQEGVATSISTTGFPPPVEDRVYVLLPPHEYFVLEGSRRPPDPDLLTRTIFVSGEQPGTVHFEDNVALAERAGGIFDINPRAVREYRRRGVAAEHLQLGYTPWLDRLAQSTNDDIDLLFLGCHTQRRARLLASYGSVLDRLRSQLIISDNSGPNFRSSASFVSGEDKLRLLGRTKVLINLHQDEEPYFEWLRVIEAIHCGTVVVSEHSTDYGPLVPGEHFVSGRGENLAYLAEELVRDPWGLNRLRQQSYEFLRDTIPLRVSARRLADLGRELGDAPLPSVGGRPMAPRPVHAMVAAVSPANPEDSLDDEVGPLIPSTPYLTDNPDIAALRRILKDMRLDLLDVRREVTRAGLGRGDHRPNVIERRFRSVGYRGQPHPRVSIITALYNHANHIGKALDSVARSRYRDIELIVVNDGSTDHSLEAVERWSSHHPAVPLLLLHHPVNRGLPYARNAALDFARGEYAFVLDADNEIYPHCLSSLTSVLDNNPEASFAYGALSAFDDDGYRHLLSHYPWEPLRLRTGNYIDAMALFRMQALKELGGYTTDRRLYGWEDYDLYARMAEAGHAGVFCGQIVARYRVSPTSMVSLSNMSITSAYSALKEHCPTLMKGVLEPL